MAALSQPDRKIRRSRSRRPTSGLPLPEALETRRLLSGSQTMFHYDAESTGVNPSETVLTPGNVNVAQFGKHWSTPMDGQVYAQPLYVSGQNITVGTSPGVHNVAYVATEHDSVYAVDGDAGNVLWQTSVLGAGETTMPAAETNSGDITVEIGITGTPVIDPNTNTLYVAAKSKKVVSGVSHYYYKLHALDLGSGAEKFGGPVEISDTAYNGSTYTYASPLTHPYVRGTGNGNITTTINGASVRIVPFNAMRQMNRPGLSLHNGQVYISFASHGDNGPYHGWVLRYDVPETNAAGGTMVLNGVLNTTPNGGLGGIWQSGGGIVFDPQGAFYFETGNGTFTNTASNFNAQGFPIDANYGDSFVKVVEDPGSTVLSQNPNGWGLKVADYFTPFNEPSLDAADTDLGSGGPLVLPDSVGNATHPHLLIGAGKEGKIYLIDRDNMGKYDAATDHVVQEQASAINGSLGVPAFFNNKIYYVGGYGDVAKTFSIANGSARFSTTPTSQSANNFSFPGSTPSITANGTTNGVVWTIDRGSNTVRAYNANGFNQLLWSSSQAANSRDQLGSVVKFTVPTAVDGKVFVGTTNALVSYGPPVPPTTIPITPTNLTAVARFATQIDLTWEDRATNEELYHVERSLTGTGGWTEIGTAGVNATSYIDSTVQPVTHYYYRIRASNALGNSGYSNVADATTSTAPPLGAGDGLLGQYYDNIDFTGTTVTRVDPTVNFDWGNGSPDPRIDANSFSVRWTGQIQAQYTDTYTFYTQSDDGVRLFVNNQLIIDNFTDHSSIENSGTINLTAGTNYPIRMEFYENGGGALAQLRWSSTATPKAVVPKSQLFSGAAPTAPSNLTATPASATQVNLAWRDNSDNESGFKIERKMAGDAGFTQVAQVGPNETSYMDPSLNAATTYTYRVRAANFGGDSAYSNEATTTLPTPPPTPSNMRPTQITTTSLHLSWQDNADNEDGWRLWRKRSDSDTFIIIGNLAPDTTSFDDSGLTPGTEYDYHLQAFNVAGYSDFAGTTIKTLTLPPTDLTAAPGDGRVALSWTAPQGAETYTVYRSAVGPDDAGAAVVTGVEGTTFTDTTAANGTTYYYHVTAVDSGGESSRSAPASATPQGTAVTHVTGLLAGAAGWAPAFVAELGAEGLGAGGFALPTDGTVGAPLPWAGLDQVVMRFDGSAPVGQGDLTVHGTNVADYAVTGFAYDEPSRTATWTLGTPVVNDNLTLNLAAAGAARPAFTQALRVLAGDANRDQVVNALDVAEVKKRLGRAPGDGVTGSGAYGVFADVNGDARINALDVAAVKRRLNNRLPAAPAPAPVSVAVAAAPKRDSVNDSLFGTDPIL
jgi:fibronectin type 3 domain-containing protein